MTHEIEAARRDLGAFARLVEANHATVCAITTAILGDPTAGEDAAQETFLTCWRKLSQLDDPARFPAWLHQIARNTARMHLRTDRRRPHGAAATGLDLAEPSASAEQALEDAETTHVVERAVAELPEDVREVLVLYYREGRSTAEVASRLALSEAAVRKRLSRARETLRADVEDRFGGWMERSRPRAGFVASVLALVAGLAPEAPVVRPHVRARWASGTIAVSVVACLVAVFWASRAPSASAVLPEGGRSRVLANLPEEIAGIVRAGPSADAGRPDAPSTEEGAVPVENPVREALAAVARSGQQRVVRCDLAALGVPPDEVVSELGSSFPPAIDLTDGVATLLVGSDETTISVSFREDQSLSVTLDPDTSGCTIALDRQVEPIRLPKGPITVGLADIADGLVLDVEKNADHDRGVTPMQIALEEPDLSPAARELLRTWVATQAEEAEIALKRAEFWSQHPEMTFEVELR